VYLIFIAVLAVQVTLVFKLKHEAYDRLKEDQKTEWRKQKIIVHAFVLAYYVRPFLIIIGYRLSCWFTNTQTYSTLT
jgi:hypothetical protein